MKLAKLYKDPASGNGGCPTVYLAEDGSLVVQGQVVNADTHANLENPLDGETAVHIDPQIVLGAISRYREVPT